MSIPGHHPQRGPHGETAVEIKAVMNGALILTNRHTASSVQCKLTPGLEQNSTIYIVYITFQRDKNFKGGPALSCKCCEDFTWEWGTSDQFFEFDIYEPSRI